MSAASFSGRHATASEAAAAHQRDFLSNNSYGHRAASADPRRRSSSMTSSAAAVRAAEAARYITTPQDDCRGHMPIRAWGCRRVKPIDAALPVSHTTRLPAQGRISKASLRTVANLPASAAAVDPVVRAAPKRACGGHTFTLPYHKQYSYYKYYGNAGQNALSAAHHNFPNGSVPAPAQLYSAGAAAAGSTVSARDRVHASEAYAARYGTLSHPIGSQRDGVTQTPMTAIHFDPSAQPRGSGAYLYGPCVGPAVSSSSFLKAGNFGYGGGQRPPQQRAASAFGGDRYSTSSSVIGSRYGV